MHRAVRSRPRFREPPLAEAICEFRFEESDGWNWTVPGRLHERLRDRFPMIEQVAPPTIVVGPPVRSGPMQVERLRFRSVDGGRIVQSGPWLLAVNMLPPYPGWEEFLEMILEIYRLHRDLVGGLAIRRLGLRYINRIDPHGHAVVDLTTVLPDLPSIFGGRAENFYERFDIPYRDPPGTLTFQTGTTGETRRTLMIDLDFWRVDVGNPDIERLADWLRQVHDAIEDAFVRALTSRTCELLGLEREEAAS
ncbi:hypothetical protein HRbin39_00863 [bacterium HR39]|nr:hypothetical protein HRbin39_00863 [bacterium HR39]